MSRFRIVPSSAAALVLGALVLAGTSAAQQPAPRQEQSYAEGTLWKIERDGVPPSYILGTLHVADTRVAVQPAPVVQLFDAATSYTMAVRYDPASVSQLGNRMIASFDLSTIVGKELYAKLRSIAPELGLQPDAVRRLKPWAVAVLLLMPQTQVQNPIDAGLAKAAVAQKKALHYLETLDEQVAFVEKLPESEQVRILRYAVDNREQMRSRTQRMVDAYLKGDLSDLMRISEEDSSPGPELKRSNAAFMQHMLDTRNARMLERTASQLKAGGAFITVGAVHLYGERGILAQVASRGYRVSRAR